MKIWEKINQKIQYIQDWCQKLTTEQKRRLALGCTGVFVLLLTLSVIISVTGKDSAEENTEEHERITINAPIPAGELFLPDEPDFVPGVILGRERRAFWSEEDAAEHWQDPLRLGEKRWREQIEAAIDELLERVP